MSKQTFSTDLAPAALGPYSQAAGTENLVFLSGQLPLDPATGAMIQGDIAARTKQILTVQVAALPLGSNIEIEAIASK